MVGSIVGYIFADLPKVNWKFWIAIFFYAYLAEKMYNADVVCKGRDWGDEDVLANAYQTLEVTKNSSNEEIKQSYSRLINETHPDKLPAECPKWVMDSAQEKFIKIQNAYEAIVSARKKK